MPKLSQFQIDNPGKWETFLSDVQRPQLMKNVYLDPTELYDFHIIEWAFVVMIDCATEMKKVEPISVAF